MNSKIKYQPDYKLALFILGLILLFLNFSNLFSESRITSQLADHNSCIFQKSATIHQLEIYSYEADDDDINEDDFLKIKSTFVIRNTASMLKNFILPIGIICPVSSFQISVMPTLMACSALGIFRL